MMLFGRPTSVPRGYARPVVVDRVIVWGVEPVFLLETVRLSKRPPLMSQRVSPPAKPPPLLTEIVASPTAASAARTVDTLFRSAQKVMEAALAAVIFRKGLTRAGSVGYP